MTSTMEGSWRCRQMKVVETDSSRRTRTTRITTVREILDERAAWARVRGFRRQMLAALRDEDPEEVSRLNLSRRAAIEQARHLQQEAQQQVYVEYR